MALNLNRVFLAGNLTRDPEEMRFTASGTPVTSFGLAVNRYFNTKDGERKEDVTYVTVVAWAKQAETCKQYLTKGSPVLVEGRLQYRSWETPNNEKRSTLEVVADRIHFVGGRREETEKLNEESHESPE